MSEGIGIDLNGLADAAAFDVHGGTVVSGTIPSVVIVQKEDQNDTKMIAGEEAAISAIGRGWLWPQSAQKELRRRIPISEIISCLQDGKPVDTAIGSKPAAELMVTAIRSLAETRGAITDTPVIVAIPDDGRFDEEARQQLLDAFSLSGMRIQLLWRPVAALLGMAPKLNELANRLDRKKIGVVSLLNEGISASVLEVRANNNPPYIIPKRTNEGVFVPFEQTLLETAKLNANELMSRFGDDGWQILWGEGFILRHFLRLENSPAIVQVDGVWRKVPVEELKTVPDVPLDTSMLQEIDKHLSGVKYLVYEGPCLEMRVGGNRLMNCVSDVLYQGIYSRETGDHRQSLAYEGYTSQLVAHGCYEYARRQAAGETTYFDQLPQIKLAVRHKGAPVFRSLIDDDDVIEGGKPYDKAKDMQLILPANSREIEFYLIREGNTSPRRATEFTDASGVDIPIQMHVYQLPAQGRAKLRLQSLDPLLPWRPIAVDWGRMEVLEDESQEDILERLRSASVAVPPVHYQPCHPFLWVVKPNNVLLAMSVVDHVKGLHSALENGQTDGLTDRVKALREAIYPYRSPYSITRNWRQGVHSERESHRVISSDGKLPAPAEGLTPETLENFDKILQKLDRLFVNRDALPVKNQLDQITLLGSWTFRRCPPEIRAYLLNISDNDLARPNDLRSMGRCFTSEKEIRSFFGAIYRDINNKQGIAKHYHVYAIFYMLSLREDAPRYLELNEARQFVKAALGRIDGEIRKKNYSLSMRTCLRAIGGLIRFRMIDQEFLSTSEYLGDRLSKQLKLLIKRSEANAGRKAVEELASQILEALEKRGASARILEWEPN